jgi:hypothetical protein
MPPRTSLWLDRVRRRRITGSKTLKGSATALRTGARLGLRDPQDRPRTRRDGPSQAPHRCRPGRPQGRLTSKALNLWDARSASLIGTTQTPSCPCGIWRSFHAERRDPSNAAARASRIRSSMATRWLAPDFGGPEVLKQAPIELGPPKEGELTVEVRAAGMNPADYKHFASTEPLRETQWPHRSRRPSRASRGYRATTGRAFAGPA